MPPPDRNVSLDLIDSYAQTGRNACPLHAAPRLQWPMWTQPTTAFIVAECPRGCSYRQQTHNHVPDAPPSRPQRMEAKLGSVATPLRPEETLYTSNQASRRFHSSN